VDKDGVLLLSAVTKQHRSHGGLDPNKIASAPLGTNIDKPTAAATTATATEADQRRRQEETPVEYERCCRTACAGAKLQRATLHKGINDPEKIKS
jgi:hypothetical protein